MISSSTADAKSLSDLSLNMHGTIFIIMLADISAIDKVQHTAAHYVMNNYSWRNGITTMLSSRHSYSKLILLL